MLGAIVGDIVGSVYEWNNIKTKEFPLFRDNCFFTDAIRNAISLGGDSDTLAAITGSIAEAAYGIPDWIKERAWSYLDDPLRDVLKRWDACISTRVLVGKFLENEGFLISFPYIDAILIYIDKDGVYNEEP